MNNGFHYNLIVTHIYIAAALLTDKWYIALIAVFFASLHMLVAGSIMKMELSNSELKDRLLYQSLQEKRKKKTK